MQRARLGLLAGLLMAAPLLAGPKPLWNVEVDGYPDKPTVADLDGSGRLQVVLATDRGTVCALAGVNGTELWRQNFADESFTSSPIVADVDHDGGAEVLIVGSRNGTLACLSGVDGTPRWSKPGRGDSIGGSAVLRDRGADTSPVLLFAQGTRLIGLDAATGDPVSETALPQDSLGTPALGLVASRTLLFIGTRRGRLLCYDTAGTPQWEVQLSGGLNAAPVVVDADGDGQDELYVLGTFLYSLTLDGRTRWQWSAPGNAGLASSLACADVNGDGRRELVLTAYDGGLYAVGADGKTKWRATVLTTDPRAVSNYIAASTPALVDTQGRIVGADAIMASPVPSAAGLLCFDGKTGQRLWRMPMSNYSQCCPVVADLTGDGKPEIIVADCKGKVHTFSLANQPTAGWLRFGGTLAGNLYETERWNCTKALLAGHMPFAVKPREVPWKDKIASQLPGATVPPTTPTTPTGPVTPTTPTTPTTPAGPGFADVRPGSEIAVKLDGKWLALDPAPVMVGGRVMVPLRGIFEALRAEIKWEAATKVITATRGTTVVMLGVGSRNVSINGQVSALDVPAQLIGGSTYVPLRFVGQALGCAVVWYPDRNDVGLTSPAVPSG
ncbi:MAG: PQQ-binding-like beta-propeller repeat protein [Armatimonadetes bacterium]|nr:PQQ-binding-like beta-propeller repeat protein [Armatimonadota bacterium]